jgi:hypothetical protein
MVQDLPDDYFVAGDNAYILISNLVISHIGKYKQDSSKDAFNFFLSQLCIRMEQGFWITFCKMAYFQEAFGSEILAHNTNH